MTAQTEQVTLSIDDLKSLERLAVTEAKLKILIDDFKGNRKLTQDNLKDIKESIMQVYELSRNFPQQIIDCRREVEHDFEGKYMTKTDGVILERHISDKVKSIKLWIVSSVGGFTSAGLVILWFFNLLKLPIA
jgi:hypothetical protein